LPEGKETLHLTRSGGSERPRNIPAKNSRESYSTRPVCQKNIAKTVKFSLPGNRESSTLLFEALMARIGDRRRLRRKSEPVISSE